MMKKILKFFMYLFAFILFFMIFLPKESLYNLLEKELEQKQIIISDEIRDEKLLSLNVSNANIFFEGINIAKVDSFNFMSLFLYTKIELTNISLIDSFTSFAPSPIDKIDIRHSILNPNKIYMEAFGLFGEMKAEINILNRVLKVELNASKQMKNSYSKLLKYFKYENERYVYEYKF
ncbi:hypothetical protein [Arcobacter defluvii]|nr:hypothetical protein [Arcobacter defluvii]RXI30790.1 hypothetical protein CP964_11090 [Arcobacter defluvii]